MFLASGAGHGLGVVAGDGVLHRGLQTSLEQGRSSITLPDLGRFFCWDRGEPSTAQQTGSMLHLRDQKARTCETAKRSGLAHAQFAQEKDSRFNSLRLADRSGTVFALP